MAYNGEQQGEYTEEYQTDYVEQSAEYQELVGLGLDAQIARELDDFFQNGEYLHFHLVIFISVSKKINVD